MNEQKKFEQKIASFQTEIQSFAEDAPAEVIESTARRLEALNFSAPVITPLQSFLRLNTSALLAEIQRIQLMDKVEACAIALDDDLKCEDLRIQHITVLLYYYKKLITLRSGNPEEWDEIDELFVHD